MEGEDSEKKEDTERETMSEDTSLIPDVGNEKDRENEVKETSGDPSMKDTSLIPDVGNEKDNENKTKEDTEKKETSGDPSMKDTSLIPDVGNEKDRENEVKETSGDPSMKDTSLIPDVGNEKDNENKTKEDTEKKETSGDPSMKDTSLIPDVVNEKDNENKTKEDTEKKETSEDPSMKDTSLIPDVANEKDEDDEAKETSEDLSMKDTSPIPDKGREKVDKKETKEDTEKMETSEDPPMKDTSLIPDVGNVKDEENEVKNDTKMMEASEDPSNMKDTSLILEVKNETQQETEEDSFNMKDRSLNPEEAEVGAAHHEVSENVPDVAPRDDVPGVDTGQELDEEDREQPVSNEESPAQEEAEEDEESSAAPAEDLTYEEATQLHQELCRERDTSVQHNSQLQVKLADYLRRKARDDPRPERAAPASEYERHVNVLGELRRRLAADGEAIRQRTEELRRLSQQNLDQAESEWRAFMTLKQQVTVATLSRRLGKQEAQTKVEATLAAEQLRQDELVELRLRHIRLKAKIHMLQAERRDLEEHGRDPLQLQYEQLQAARLEQKKRAEKQSEESTKLQAKISSGLEVLTNVKEKLFWTQRDVHAKREQLAEVEAMVARKRDALTRIKQARNRLQRDNQRLKERRGLLGNEVLLRDFEDTVDASGILRERLENLKCRQTEIVLSCARWKKLETNQ